MAHTGAPAPRANLENDEKVTGPHSGVFGVVSVLTLTALTWLLLWTLHVRLYHDPMNPLSPNEGTTEVRSQEPPAPHAPPPAAPARQPQ